MSNPQTNMINNGMTYANNHVSGRFAGSNVNNNVQNEEHSSTLHSNVNTNMQNNSFFNNTQQQNDTLPVQRSNKFVKDNVVVSDTKIKTNMPNEQVNEYLNDPRVRANLEANKNASQLIDTKTMMVLGLIVMIFIFLLPMVYDLLNQ